MHFLTKLTIAVFIAFLAFLAFASPLAHTSQPAALLAAGVVLFVTANALAPRTDKLFLGVTVDAALRLDKILAGPVLKALKRILLPLNAFSVVYRDVPLAGTDIVHVPYIPIDGTTSTDFDADDGYVVDGSGTVNTRPVTINKRKYQSLGITGRQLAREPVLELESILVRKAEKLAEDVITDIFSIVTAANFGAAVFTGAASTFDSDDITDLRAAALAAMWGETGRSLVVNTDYDAHLLKDTAVRNALNFGNAQAIQEGRVARILGFDYHAAPVLPSNSENLVGFISLGMGVLTAFAPIPPPPKVRQLVDYRSVSDENGLTVEFRNFAEPLADQDDYIIEVNYGKAVGDAAQLKRLVSA